MSSGAYLEYDPDNNQRDLGRMNAFIRCSFIAIGVQLVAVAAVAMATHGSSLLIIVDAYYPMIFLITKVGGFTGESTMMLPVALGVPLGILLYGILLSLLINFLKSLKL